MKQFKFQMVAVALAIICIAFSEVKLDKKQATYIWFYVKVGSALPCASFGSVTQSQLVWVPRSSPSSTALLDLTPFTMTKVEAIVEFGCPSETYVCGVAYPILESAFELVTVNGVQYWRPKATTAELDKICRVQQ